MEQINIAIQENAVLLSGEIHQTVSINRGKPQEKNTLQFNHISVKTTILLKANSLYSYKSIQLVFFQQAPMA